MLAVSPQKEVKSIEIPVVQACRLQPLLTHTADGPAGVDGVLYKRRGQAKDIGFCLESNPI